MLEIRHVTKTYHSKTGEAVKALDDVSISFPESGMVFILGKSGSGKSTLLNAIGGLDSIDGGEFVIMGKSSADFVGSDFDAYRNTFIGFIFQEYNVLDEFTVGANIALALELQGKKATDEQINDILAQVDMLSFAKRKPNELSGGQKQRIAIARALVKDPQIIMADEPTGALDSNTGKQIFDTLKALSKEKLVLVVSHDRDFAERYADRIVELADGHIISDVTKHTVEGKSLCDGIRQISPHILQIRRGYRLTPADVEMINDYLATNADEVLLSGDSRVNGELRSAAGITDDGGTAVFEKTDPEKDVTVRQYDGKKTKFIRSSLPLKNAVKIGASGLKYKRFRLVFTILLSLVSFAMFGLADTMAAYNKTTAATSSIMDSRIGGAVFTLGVKTVQHGGGYDYTYYNSANLNDDDLAYLSRETGLRFYPVYNGGAGFDLSGMMASGDYKSVAYEGRLYGFTSLTTEDITAAGLSLIGRMPGGKSEIVISEFLFRQFRIAGFRNESAGESVEKNQLTTETGGAQNSIIGKHLTISAGGRTTNYEIVGVVDTHFDYDRYADYLPKDNSSLTPGGNGLADMLLQAELGDTLRYGFHTLGFLTQDAIAGMAASGAGNTFYGKNIPLMGEDDGVHLTMDGWAWPLQDFYTMGGSDILPFLNVTWCAGHSALGANEYLVHEDVLDTLYYNLNALPDTTVLDRKSIELFGQEAFDQAKDKVRNDGGNYWGIVQTLSGGTMNDDALRAAYLPALAEMYGLTIRENTPDAALSRLWEQVRLIPLATDGSQYQFYFDNLSRLTSEWYCYQSIADNALLSDPDFADMVKNMIGVDLAEISDSAKWTNACVAYSNYLQSNPDVNAFGDRTYRQLKNEAKQRYLRMTNSNEETLYSALFLGVAENGEAILGHDWKLVGTYSGYQDTSLIISDTLVSELDAWQKENNADSYWWETAPHKAGYWASAVAIMPRDRAAVEKLVQLSYREGEDLQFTLQNSVMFTLSTFNSFIETGASVFLYIGIGFAVFSVLLLMNFISLSIAYKKREIGILRAVGARSSDVYKIFFSESLIIALINYVLAVAATLLAVFYINRWMYSEGIRITLLTFGVRQLGLMLLISIAVAALASFLPVWKIARKKPVDAIKNR